ncbi:hypothetical protein HIM_07575 [Hirsutella minnesotensis 3608]|uniref:Geranylgeranyl pyrophosphate synthase n=1 Tax=Hirsutella minnesotensis 3608 TaxID=1043627 RepID=A0A0F7ZTF1_9HYPO|nr:hypothetical protein HIM_07575 [Hirsutella minnesotensis 3608]
MSTTILRSLDLIKSRVGINDLASVLVAFSIGFFAKGSASSKGSTVKTVLEQAAEQYGYCKELPAERPAHADIDCPYEYLLRLYGKHHFRPFVTEFDPTLEAKNPAKFTLILDIMDAVHFALILVDDISDNSNQRKNQPTAHLIYGASETANRAYLVLTRVINRALREQPVLGVELLKALEDILQGQDMSLIWRRDGLDAFHYQGDESIQAYKKMATLKTGTLFLLLGRLVKDGGQDLDDLLTRFGWYAQLQNDCKNIYSEEYVSSKGAVAEDLRNGELSFPIVVALNEKSCCSTMQRALRSHADAEIEAAMTALQSKPVKQACLKALKEAGVGMDGLVSLWGRREQMQAAAPRA